jgi:Helix-turn-helix domain
MHGRLAATPQEGLEPESLHRRVARCKGRWLKRAMLSTASPAQKVFAFFVFDHLNCVTLDAWPSQETIAEYMHCSTKTVRRAAEGLQAISLIHIRRVRVLNHRPRYAPVFTADDWDTGVPPDGQRRAKEADGGVQESTLGIHINKSTSTDRQAKPNDPARYRQAERGRWELELIEALGSGGQEMVETLSLIDDVSIDRLCRSLAEGNLGEREIEDARLAVLQARFRGRGR